MSPPETECPTYGTTRSSGGANEVYSPVSVTVYSLERFIRSLAFPFNLPVMYTSSPSYSISSKLTLSLSAQAFHCSSAASTTVTFISLFPTLSIAVSTAFCAFVSGVRSAAGVSMYWREFTAGLSQLSTIARASGTQATTDAMTTKQAAATARPRLRSGL